MCTLDLEQSRRVLVLQPRSLGCLVVIALQIATLNQALIPQETQQHTFGLLNLTIIVSHSCKLWAQNVQHKCANVSTTKTV